MKDEEKKEANYIKGFNDGYILTKYMPEMAEMITRATGESARLQGLIKGREKFLSEQLKDKQPTWLTGKRSTKSKSEPSKDKDIEPER